MKKEDTFADLELTFQGDSDEELDMKEEGGFEDIEIKFDGNSDEAMTMTAVDDTQVANELSVTDYMNDMIRLEKVNNGIMTFVLLLMIISSALKFAYIKSSILSLILGSFMSFTCALNSANRAIILITSSLFKINFVYIILFIYIFYRIVIY